MFTDVQKSALQSPLARSSVKTRTQAGRELSYIESWFAISEANRIFGFDAWDRETVSMVKLGDPYEKDGKWYVAFMAQVRVTVRAGDTVILRMGSGYGSGISKNIGDAYESALKEAESDAAKRALMTFGNPFGLALYDKEQAGVVDDTPKAAPKTTTPFQPPAKEPSKVEIFLKRKSLTIAVPGMKLTPPKPNYSAWAESMRTAIDACRDEQTLTKLWADNGDQVTALRRANPDLHDETERYADQRRYDLTQPVTIAAE